MAFDQSELPIEQMRLQIAKMQEQTSRAELFAQHMRTIRNKLDQQIDTFTRIHQYAQRAFRCGTLGELNEIIAEGVIDIFQLEVGIVFEIDLVNHCLTVQGRCNLDESIQSIPLSGAWMSGNEMLSFSVQQAIVESTTDETPWSTLNLVDVIYMPIFDNSRSAVGIVAGGITKDNRDFFDFEPQEIHSSFMVYCQQMNGIYNNLIAIRQVMRADQAKNRFFANLSHEIRTPMNAIIGMAQVAERSTSTDEMHKCVGQIKSASKHLLGLLNDVLDISKIEEGKLVLVQEPFMLRDVLDSVTDSIAQSAGQKGLHFAVDRRDIVHDALIGDAMRLSQVLLNLLSNAVKFTPEGGSVLLSVEEISRDAQKVLMRFSVEDTGIGIDPVFLSRMFSPFEQADSSTSRQYGGTGLGLAISQRIVNLMGGTIQVESEVNRGTRFYFSCWFESNAPDLLQKEDGAPPEDLSLLSGLRVLVVDDVDINREIIRSLFSDLGMDIQEASNGLEALTLFENAPVGTFDMILMDIQMPVMDGYEATAAIRALNRADAKRVIILAMTANVFKEDVERVVNTGMDGHIGKPIEYTSMLATMQHTLLRKRST